MPVLPKSINWSLIRKHAWYEGVIVLLFLPVAMPISFWYFQTVLPINLDMSVGGLDAFGQLLLAGIVGLFAIIAGVAIDVGLVRIATGMPTHENRWKSLNFWVPVVYGIATCVITIDYYTNHTWDITPSTLAHLAYPIATFFAALYWSWSRDWHDQVTAPFRTMMESLEIRYQDLQDQFGARLAESTDQLTKEVKIERARADELNRIIEEGAKLTTLMGDSLAESYAEFKTQMRSEVQSLRSQLREVIEENTQLQEELDQKRPSEPAIFKYATMKQAIEGLLSDNPDMTTDQLSVLLNIAPDQLKNFRSQVSQVRSSLPSMAA